MSARKVIIVTKVPANIRRFRIERGLTQADLGKLLGKAPSVIANWEAETNRPDVGSIGKMMEIFDVDANTLFGWAGPKSGALPRTTSPQGQRIGRAYDKATPPVQKTVEVALEPYMGEEVCDEERETIEMKVFDMPAAAGFGNYLSEADEFDMMPYPVDDVPRRADFGIRISGDSMEPTICDDSIVWVEAMPEVRSGDVGIFILNGDAYCKRLCIDETRRVVLLCSDNESYSDMKIGADDDLRTVGRVL